MTQKSALLSPLASVFGLLVDAKNYIYDKGWKSSVDVAVPVVSVGNLTVGGTGKTPLLIHLLDILKESKIKVGVVSRGYKSEVQGVAEVGESSVVYYGDEPTLVKQRHPDVPFFIGANRPEACQALLEQHEGVQLILADDAFQHRRLKRELDIVVLDATRDRSHYSMLPQGMARESFASLSRAHVLVFTKLNIPGAKTPQEILGWIQEAGVSIDHLIVVESEVSLEAPKHLFTGESSSAKQGWTLLSAIGNPKAFEESVRSLLDLEFSEHRVLRDHAEFQIEDVYDLLGKCDQCLVTEKDAVKLKTILAATDQVYSTRLEYKIRSGREKLVEKLHSLVG